MMANDKSRSLVANFPAIIRHTVWLYIRFTLGYRDVEELLAERCLDLTVGKPPFALA
jgi:transposase-like protein